MLACFETNFDSESSSDDISLQFFSKVGRFHKSQVVTPKQFIPSSFTLESKFKSRPKAWHVSTDFEKNLVRTNGDSSEDYIAGDTPLLLNAKLQSTKKEKTEEKLGRVW